jgi:gliding motility associated protien GldN
MKVQLRFIKLCLIAGTVLTSSMAFAQDDTEGGSVETNNEIMPAVPANPTAAPAPGARKEAGGDPVKKTEAGSAAADPNAPLDSPYERKIFKEKRVLTYDDIREADVFFEKRIWRVIDVREKLNKPFMYPKEPFINIIMDAAKNKEVSLYSTVDGDEFKTALTAEEAKNIGSSVDTVVTYNPETYEEQIKVVANELNFEDIKRFRVKEVWFFDKESSTLQCRILGIAPIKEVKDDKGNFRYEQPMFWAYYPTLRQVLARHEAFNPLNDAQRMTWEDVFEMRLFSSYIMKESNVYDRRIEGYKQGIDILLEGENIKNSIFNFEHDLWSY